jgi:hypothetical protein
MKNDLERKGVRFEVRVKIHEFEKYLEDVSDNDPGDASSDNEGYDSEYEQ